MERERERVERERDMKNHPLFSAAALKSKRNTLREILYVGWFHVFDYYNVNE